MSCSTRLHFFLTTLLVKHGICFKFVFRIRGAGSVSQALAAEARGPGSDSPAYVESWAWQSMLVTSELATLRQVNPAAQRTANVAGWQAPGHLEALSQKQANNNTQGRWLLRNEVKVGFTLSGGMTWCVKVLNKCPMTASLAPTWWKEIRDFRKLPCAQIHAHAYTHTHTK